MNNEQFSLVWYTETRQRKSSGREKRNDGTAKRARIRLLAQSTEKLIKQTPFLGFVKPM